MSTSSSPFRRLFHDVHVDRAAALTPALLARAALLVVLSDRPGPVVNRRE